MVSNPSGHFDARLAPTREANMTKTTKAERHLAHEQALASTRIAGHQPSPEFLADCEAVIEGAMTNEEARAASLARARLKDDAVVEAVAGNCPRHTNQAGDRQT